MNSNEAFDSLEKGIYSALETYSNVHRGSGHKSVVTTHLYEQARSIVLDYLGLSEKRFIVIFCSKRGASALTSVIETGRFQTISSGDIGLPLGVWAVAAERKALPGGAPFISGGGTARLISPGWVVWDKTPDRFEPGTPSIINIITFARALSVIKKSGTEIFMNPQAANLTGKEILYSDNLNNFSGKELLSELRKTIIGAGVSVPTAEGIRTYINLDNSASTPAFSTVWNAVRITWRQPQNIQQEIIEEARSVCARFLGAPQSEYDTIFTSNTTDAINIVAESLKHESSNETETIVLSTILEHSSNDLPWRAVADDVIRLSINEEGFIDLKELESLLSDYNQKFIHGNKRIKIVSITGASNVLGICNDIMEISTVVHKFGARLFVDAAQLVAHRKVEMERSGIDYLAISAHKVYAPFGTGVLVAKKGLLNFSQSELKQINESGEENPGGIAALCKTLILLERAGMEEIMKEEQVLTKRLLQGMSKIEGITVFGVKNPDSPSFVRKGGVIVFGLKGMMSNSVAEELAVRRGIGIRYGCHCAHILIKHILGLSPGLQKFQRIIVTLFPFLRLPGLARVSLGIGNTEEEIDTFLSVLRNMSEKKEKSSNKETELLIKKFVSEASVKVYSVY